MCICTELHTSLDNWEAGENLVCWISQKFGIDSAELGAREKKDSDNKCNTTCVGQFCPGFQQCKGKGPAQYLVWRDTNIRGRPAEERIKLPSEERCITLSRSCDCVRGRWSPRHFCPRCLVNLLITQSSAQDNLITAQRGKYPTKSNGRKWQISSGAVTSALNVSQLTFWPH